MSPREADPYAALRRGPLALPLAVGAAVTRHGASLHRRRDDLPGALRADLAGAGRLLSAVGGRSGSRWEPEDVVAELAPGRLVRLHSGGAGVSPVLVVVPQGTNPAVLLAGEESVAGALRAEGCAVYAVDWTGPGAGDDVGIEDLIDAIGRAADHLGGRIHLVGCSQGGWMSAISASLRPSTVASLTLVGAPLTFHVGSPAAAASGLLALVRRVPPVDVLLRGTVPWWAGWQHAALSGDVWWMVDPVGEAVRLVRALGAVGGSDGALGDNDGALGDDDELGGNDDELTSAATELGMFSGTPSMSLQTYLWFAEHLLLDDAFARGVLEIGGEPADPAAITCPVRLVAGTRDTLVPLQQVFAAARVLTGAAAVERVSVDAGHLELFTTAAHRWAGPVGDGQGAGTR
ncbi:MAG: alpha/beta hydrolase [Actinomycetales bacterium]|nr:alpha/beta hydrolase [Actinomycetales bacterium]